MASGPAPQRNVQKADTSTFDLGFGERVQFEPLGLGFKLQTYFIGMVRYKYIIVRLSSLGTMASMVYEQLYKDNSCKLFYTREGVLHGFMSKVISYITTPYRHVYLTYPHDAEFFTMRGHERHQCHVPASVQLSGEEYRGMALNFSEGGCCVCLCVPEEQQKRFTVGTSLDVGCSLVSAQGVSQAVCCVRNVRAVEDKLVLGLSFEDIPDVSRQRVLAFLEHLARFS